MNTVSALILLFSICAAASALLIITIYLVRVKKKTGAPIGAEKNPTVNSDELRSVLDSITDYICIIDEQFKIRYANKSYLEFTGQIDGGSTCHRLFWKRTDPCDSCPALETFRKGLPVLRKKFILNTGTGNVASRHLEISTYPIVDKNNLVVRVIEYIRDMTQESNMLEELIRSEKLAGVGVMTTGIAHEMNNALSGISGTASNLLTMPEKYGLNEKGANRVMTILDSATRATGVIKNLLQFSSPLQEETRVMVNVKQLLKKIVTSAYIQEAPLIDRRMKFDDALPLLSVDLSKIELVFMNIISNAIRSVQQKNARYLKESVPFRGSLIVTAQQKQEFVLITFTDNGVGIPEEAQPKIFDPFFSTWPGGSGTGLGLSTAMHIVEEHGGQIFFESNETMTTFSVQLPITASQPQTINS